MLWHQTQFKFELIMGVVAMIIVAALCCQANSQPRCLFQPLPGPEVDYDFYGCSYVLDWRRNFPKVCQEAKIRYEVQFVTGCTNDSLSFSDITEEKFSIPDEVLNGCLGTGNSNCYARVRAEMSDTSWSEYSAWANIFNEQHETVQACIVNGSDLCLPIEANCADGIFPEFVINQEHYLFQDLLNSMNNLNITYDHLQRGYDVCFKNVTTDVSYIEFCPSHPVCTIFSPSIDGEFAITNRAVIEIKTNQCSACSYAYSQIVSTDWLGRQSLYTQGNHCVVVDFTNPGMEISPSKESVCVSIVSPEHILPSTMVYLNLTRFNGATSNTMASSSVLINASKPIHCEVISKSKSLEMVLTRADTGSIIYLPRPCITMDNDNLDGPASSDYERPRNKSIRECFMLTLNLLTILALGVCLTLNE